MALDGVADDNSRVAVIGDISKGKSNKSKNIGYELDEIFKAICGAEELIAHLDGFADKLLGKEDVKEEDVDFALAVDDSVISKLSSISNRLTRFNVDFRSVIYRLDEGV